MSVCMCGAQPIYLTLRAFVHFVAVSYGRRSVFIPGRLHIASVEVPPTITVFSFSLSGGLTVRLVGQIGPQAPGHKRSNKSVENVAQRKSLP